jgi:cell division GTPase FtsZ
VACVKAFAIDVDATTLTQLKGMPEEAKIYFPALDPGPEDAKGESTQTATIDIGEIISRVQNIEYAETDAIFICCGLGGSMVDVAPHIIAALRNSITEPIFGLITLPCLAEGERKSGKAADDIDMLSPLLDGIILFDNETWFKKIRSQKSTLAKKDKSFGQMMGFVKEQPVLSPKLATYLLLNDAIVRRISLILRAGEFKADGGVELAEVVLDSGEVLNTMKGMGFITIGYAVEHLPHDPLGFFSWLRPAGILADDHKKRASRLVELAKQAIYHEISTPCDMTSAHKALILIAGPTHELSMKGFMTVRKWIDRSIAGLETRSGDYPVVNTKNVAIIIMLSGLENIPRIDEIREIRAQGRTGYQKKTDGDIESLSLESITLSTSTENATGTDTPSQKQRERQPRDDMISLPVKEYPGRDSGSRSLEVRQYSPESLHTGISGVIKKGLPGGEYLSHADTTGVHEGEQHHKLSVHPPQPRIFVSQEHEPIPRHISPVNHSQTRKELHHDKPEADSTTKEPARAAEIPVNDSHIRAKDTDRQRIEKDLQRQRMIAISGRSPKVSIDALKKTVLTPGRIVIHHEESTHSPTPRVPEHNQPSVPVEKNPEQKTIIIGKRKRATITDTRSGMEEHGINEPAGQDNSISPDPKALEHQDSSDMMKVSVKDPSYRAKDDVFGGKSVERTAVPSARDSGLIHTHRIQIKKVTGTVDENQREAQADPVPEKSEIPEKKRKITTKNDEISWI